MTMVEPWQEEDAYRSFLIAIEEIGRRVKGGEKLPQDGYFAHHGRRDNRPKENER